MTYRDDARMPHLKDQQRTQARLGQSLIGMNIVSATATAVRQGYFVQVVKFGHGAAVTADMRPDRITLSHDADGVVVNVLFG